MLSLKTTQFFKTRPQQELEGEMHVEWEWVKMMLLDWISDKGGWRIWITLAATFAANAIIIKKGGSSNTDYGRNRSFPASKILFHNSYLFSLSFSTFLFSLERINFYLLTFSLSFILLLLFISIPYPQSSSFTLIVPLSPFLASVSVSSSYVICT